jgi:hypothetical protein
MKKSPVDEVLFNYVKPGSAVLEIVPALPAKNES